MVVIANPFSDWTDFPRGLQVLLVSKDITHNTHVRVSLERCHYIVTTLRRGEDAVAALQNTKSTFHLALVEATKDDEFEGFQFLKAAGDLPTIMMTETENMAIIMEGIALGAADFLQKPVTEEKLRNIWQHLARKAFIAGGQKIRECPKQPDFGDCLCQSMQEAYSEAQDSSTHDALKHEHSGRHANNDKTIRAVKQLSCEKLPTPLRPQIEQLVRVSSCEDMLDLSPMSDRLSEVRLEIEDIKREVDASTQESLYSELKFEDYTCSKVEFDDSFNDIAISNGMILHGDEGPDTEINANMFVGLPDSDSDSALDFNFELLDCSQFQDAENEEEEDFLVSELVKVEEDSFGADMLDCFLQSPPHDGEGTKEKKVDQIKSERNGKGAKSFMGRKKMKVDWTAELHHKFVQAVEQLGVEKAIPSKILELMGVKCLTRHNIASHLQKYRSNRKHHLYRESRAAIWRNGRSSDSSLWTGTKRDGTPLLPSHKSNLAPIQPRLPVAMYPVQPTGFPRPPLHVWGHPTMDHSSVHMWHQPPMNAPTAWRSSDGTIWQHPAASFDGWVPTSPAPGAPCLPHPLMKVPLAPISHVIQVGVPVIPGEEESMLDYPADSAESEMSVGAGAATLEKPSILHPPKEVVDAVINEALRNPITLPLGLKPPSMESVMAELQKQGISGIGRSPP
ncbi:hypothetical protein O6H91_23G016000 [Diphasiastrum complanatum]|uniref:Uncharacterized protein n=1 Tax=Diphasiastrum complanatum TaxID=34168 RepID=A0ACC2A8E0_DIPCM|nr:hypothetical protein O6H91_23G016000 [Diphasiastrum complanatum]